MVIIKTLYTSQTYIKINIEQTTLTRFILYSYLKILKTKFKFYENTVTVNVLP